jgi:hypothetical protein
MKFLFVFFLSFFLQPTQDKVLVCLSKKAYAYHQKQCSGLQRCGATIDTITLAEAKKNGRTPCRTCYKSLPSPNEKQASSGQCRATTKKGTRCSRNASSGGYCWQHG